MEVIEPAVEGTKNVLEACAKTKGGVKRVVLTSSCASIYCEFYNSISFLQLAISQNGPFAANGREVQNPPCWRASYALGHPKQRKFKFVLMKSLCSGCPSAQLALQHGGFCTM